MTDEQFMRLAITEAKKSTEKNPCGIVIVKDNRVIAAAYNSHHDDHDATAHAEIKAIRLAGHKLGTKNLHGTSAYCTCEPCTMCSGALLYAEVDKIVYGVTMTSIDPDNSRIMTTLEELVSKVSKKPEIKGGVLKEECKQELYGK